MKNNIYEQQLAINNQVTSFNSELMTRKGHLERACAKVLDWLSSSHVTEQIEQIEQVTHELKRSLDLELNVSYLSSSHIPAGNY